jgi:hypothetical protein
MDVVTQNWDFDYNLFAVNPTWNYTLVNGVPPDPTKLCPVGSDDPAKWRASDTCTDQDVYLNQATGWKQMQCWIHGRAIQGHMNFFPVTYRGRLYWDSHSPPGGDDDYNFGIFRDDKALYTAGNDVIHAEFDSDETVDQWDDTDTWWERFHDAVDRGDDDAREMVNGHDTIVMALVGLDGGHDDFKSELHPVYAMFIHIKADPADDQWAFFIRNWGNEGSCSNSQEYINYTTLFVELPHDNFQSVQLSSNNIWGINFEDPGRAKVTYQESSAGVVFAFAFDNPHKKETYVGDLHLHWSASSTLRASDSTAIATPSSVASSKLEPEGSPEATTSMYYELSPASKQLLTRRLRALNRGPRLRTATVPIRQIDELEIHRRKAIAELKRQRRLPDYRSLLLSENDPSIYLEKKRQLDMVNEFLNAH